MYIYIYMCACAQCRHLTCNVRTSPLSSMLIQLQPLSLASLSLLSLLSLSLPSLFSLSSCTGSWRAPFSAHGRQAAGSRVRVGVFAPLSHGDSGSVLDDQGQGYLPGGGCSAPSTLSLPLCPPLPSSGVGVLRQSGAIMCVVWYRGAQYSRAAYGRVVRRRVVLRRVVLRKELLSRSWSGGPTHKRCSSPRSSSPSCNRWRRSPRPSTSLTSSTRRSVCEWRRPSGCRPQW